MDVPILSLLVLLPLIGAVLTLFMGGARTKYAKVVAAVFTAAALVLSLYVMFMPSGDLANPTSTPFCWRWRSDSWACTWRRTTSCSTSCGRSR